MKVAEYARETKGRGHRIASGLVFAVWIGRAFALGGIDSALRTFVGFLLPVACIWFPEGMSRYRGVFLGGGYYINEPSHPGFLRGAGWFLLVGVPIAIYALN